MFRRSSLQKILLVVALLFIAAWRGWNLWFRGIIDHDEGHALLNANTWHQIMRWALSGGLWDDAGASIAQLRDTLHQQGGTLYSAGKFGYSLLLAVVALPGQVTVNEGLMLAWLCGLAVCALVGLLTWQYCDSIPAAGLAALGCAGSPLIGALSREISGTIWAVMFGLAGACAMQAGADATSGRRRCFWGTLAGLCLGYGFTCHHNLAPFILAVFLAYGFHGMRGTVGFERIRRFVRSIAPAAIASLLVLAAFEIVTRIVDYRLRNVFPEYLSFFGEFRNLLVHGHAPMLHGVFRGDGAIGWGADAWAVYLQAAWKEGAVWIALLVFGVPWIILRSRSRLPGSRRAMILLFVPLIFWLAYVYKVERVLGMCVAASWVLIGVTVFSPLCRRLANDQNHGRPGRAFFLLVGMIVMGIVAILPAWQDLHAKHSLIPNTVFKTLEYVKSNEGQITAGSFDRRFAPVWKWTIVRQMRNPEFHDIKPHVDFSRFKGADIVFIDPNTWHRSGAPDFTISKEKALGSRVITVQQGISPKWHLESRDLRFPRD